LCALCLHHQGKPVVLLWGLGFRDRPWSPAQGAELVEFFKHDSKYGGVHLIGGVDPFWRTLRGESRPDEGSDLLIWDQGRLRVVGVICLRRWCLGDLRLSG